MPRPGCSPPRTRAAACDAEKLGELYLRQQGLEARLEQEMTRWEELSLQLEEQEN